MSSLTNQAEASLIGALLAHHQELDLTVHDFSHPGYRAIYDAITHTRATRPDLDGEALTTAVAGRANAPGLGSAELQRLADDCPSPDHITAYARMVQAASVRRDIHTATEEISRKVAAGDATPELERLAAALTRQAAIHTHLDTQLGRATTTGPADPGSAQKQREDDVLAGVLQYPEQARTLSTIVPLDAFSTDQRRDIFETAVSLASSGDPVDEVIVAWEIQATQYIRQLSQGNTPPRTGEPTPSYLHQLAHRPINIHTATTSARHLATTHTQQQLANRTAATAPQQRTIHTRQFANDTTIAPPPRYQPGPAPTPRLNGPQGA